MRAALAGASLILLAACGGPEQAEGPSASEVADAPAAASGGAAVKIPATIADALTIMCGKPFAQDATAGTLADIFGDKHFFLADIGW
ncbi:MAG TPA: hypothetical protein PLN33_14035, partial [Hyphomonadaceae bacterium]|nr:hypothetical protein [Hyphomonadaceae bacterium]